MAKRTTYTLGPDVPDDEVLRDSRGRPSLSESGESPLLRVRLSRELDDAVRKAAQEAGASRSDWVRQALDEASRKAG